MDWSQQQRVEDDAPSHLQLPTGSTTPIDYSSGTQPRARVKLQEVFGLADTPLLGGRGVGVPLLLELLSPAGRPLQVCHVDWLAWLGGSGTSMSQGVTECHFGCSQCVC